METLKEFWHWLTTSRYTRFLEEENARLWAMIEQGPQRTEAPKSESREHEPVPRRQIRSWARMRQQLEASASDPLAKMEEARSRRVAARLAVEE